LIARAKADFYELTIENRRRRMDLNIKISLSFYDTEKIDAEKRRNKNFSDTFIFMLLQL
jgi:hypothetical protein